MLHEVELILVMFEKHLSRVISVHFKPPVLSVLMLYYKLAQRFVAGSVICFITSNQYLQFH